MQFINEESFPITFGQLTDSWTKWINDSSLRSSQRFGQYVVNKYCPVNSCWPECYYETDRNKAYQMLFKASQYYKRTLSNDNLPLTPVDWVDI